MVEGQWAIFIYQQTVYKGCLVQVGNGIELEAVGLQFEPYQWRPCGVTWDSSRTVVVIKLLLTSGLCLDSNKGKIQVLLEGY